MATECLPKFTDVLGFLATITAAAILVHLKEPRAVIDCSQPSSHNPEQFVPILKPRVYSCPVKIHSLAIVSQKPLKHVGYVGVNGRSDPNVVMLPLARAWASLDRENSQTKSPACRENQVNVVFDP